MAMAVSQSPSFIQQRLARARNANAATRGASVRAAAQDNKANQPAAKAKTETASIHQPKIGTVAVIAGYVLLGAADVVEVILILFALDDFLLIDLITFPITQGYLRYKRARGAYGTALRIVEWIPYVGWLPLKTLAWGLVTWIDRHPEGKIALAANTATKPWKVFS